MGGGGNQREQRGLEADNKPSVQSGLPLLVGGLALVTAPLCRGQGGSLTSREAAAFSCVLMPVDPGTRKGPSQDIFQIHLQTVSLFHLVMPWSTQGALGLEVCFHPTGRTFLWELDWKGWEKRILLSLLCVSSHPPLTGSTAKNKLDSTPNLREL